MLTLARWHKSHNDDTPPLTAILKFSEALLTGDPFDVANEIVDVCLSEHSLSQESFSLPTRDDREKVFKPLALIENECVAIEYVLSPVIRREGLVRLVTTWTLGPGR